MQAVIAVGIILPAFIITLLLPISPHNTAWANRGIEIDDNFRRVALVIGNSDYSGVTPLKNPKHDAEAIAKKLKEIGFEYVKLVKDLKFTEFHRVTNAFKKQADNSDFALVYYAGHGMESNSTYLFPTDFKDDPTIITRRNFEKFVIDVKEIAETIQGAKQHSMMILDSCRNDPLKKETRRVLFSSPLRRGQHNNTDELLDKRLGLAQNTIMFYAAKPGQEALDGENSKNSPFTSSLLRHLSQPGLTVARLNSLVSKDVQYRTKNLQTPGMYASDGLEFKLTKGDAPEIAKRIAANNKLHEAKIAALKAEQAAEIKASVQAVLTKLKIKNDKERKTDALLLKQKNEQIAALNQQIRNSILKFETLSNGLKVSDDRKAQLEEEKEKLKQTQIALEKQKKFEEEKSKDKEQKRFEQETIALKTVQTKELEAKKQLKLAKIAEQKARDSLTQLAALDNKLISTTKTFHSKRKANNQLNSNKKNQHQEYKKKNTASIESPSDFNLADGNNNQLEKNLTDKDNLIEQQYVFAIQEELKRVGCYHGKIDGIWGISSRKALKTFVKLANLPATRSLSTNNYEPSDQYLNVIKRFNDIICPQEFISKEKSKQKATPKKSKKSKKSKKKSAPLKLRKKSKTKTKNPVRKSISKSKRKTKKYTKKKKHQPIKNNRVRKTAQFRTKGPAVFIRP